MGQAKRAWNKRKLWSSRTNYLFRHVLCHQWLHCFLSKKAHKRSVSTANTGIQCDACLSSVIVQVRAVLRRTAGCKKHSIYPPETSYFVCGTSVSWYLLIQRTSKHLGHHFSAYFSGQAIKHACSFRTFQLAQRTSRVKSWTWETEDLLAHWTSRSQFFFLPWTVLRDWHFDHPSRSHLTSQAKSLGVCI